LAEEHDRLEAIFVNEDDKATKGISHNGIYAFNFYALMMPVTITIDDRLPMKKDKEGKTLYAKIGRDHSVWAPLFEKAFAKYHGTYEPLWAGNPREALEVIAGSPGIRYETEEINVDALWDLLSKQDLKRAMITMGDPVNDSKHGIVSNHAYSFIKTVRLSNGTRLVQCRNPWGREKYHGPWSRDDNENWTTAFKRQAGFDELFENEGNEGVFFTTIDIFKESFGLFWINYDTRDLYRDEWLKLDDTTRSPGSNKKCGSECTRHEFTLTSDVTQTVYVSANTWSSRGYPDSCRDGATKTNDGKKHILSVEGFKEVKFNKGTEMFEPFIMKAGDTLDLYIEMDFTRAEMAHDVSVVVWGEEGQITLNHKKGIKSDHFKQLK
jgi:hypothetical protein